MNPYISVRNRAAELVWAQTTFEHGSDQGKGVQRFLGERDWELQSARARVQELESMIKRQGSRMSFESVVCRDPQTPPGLPAATQRSRPMSVPDPWHEWHETSIRDDVLEQLFQNPVLNPGHVQHEHARVSPAPPLPGGGHDDSSSSSSSDDDAQRRKKKNNKKQKKGSYKVKNAEMRLPQYPNALTVQSWHRSVRTAAISACEKPERARAFVCSPSRPTKRASIRLP